MLMTDDMQLSDKEIYSTKETRVSHTITIDKKKENVFLDLSNNAPQDDSKVYFLI
jgi:hypothetical protein